MIKSISSAALAVIFVSLSPSTQAQQQIRVKAGDGIDVKKIEMQAQPTPVFQAAGVRDKKFKPRDWLEVEVEFDAKAVDPRDGVIPEILFRYYVAMVDKEGNPVVMTGDITHLNVVGGETYFSAIYVSPATLGKITGDYRTFNINSVKAVGVEIFYNGVLVGGGTEGVSGKFWEGKTTSPGVLSRSETPFGILWIDRYADEKPKS